MTPVAVESVSKNARVRESDFSQVPTSINVCSHDEANQFETGTVEVVRFEDTALNAIPDSVKQLDSVLWAWLITFWNSVLLPAISLAAQTREDLKASVDKRTQDVKQQNAPIEARLARLDEIEEGLYVDHRARIANLADTVPEAVAGASVALTETNQVFTSAALEVSCEVAPKVLSREALAAREQLPFEAQEPSRYLSALTTFLCSIPTGTIFGLSLFSIPDIVHLSNLKNTAPVLIGMAALVGIAVTTFAGRVAKHLFEGSAEAFYLKSDEWKGYFLFSTSVTAVMVVCYGIVDSIGLMKASKLQDAFLQLSGQAVRASGPTPLMVIAAGSVGFIYLSYWAVIGWRKQRSAALNGVILAEELELQNQDHHVPKSVPSSEAKSSITALNSIREIGIEFALTQKLFEHSLSTIAAERASLVNRLVPIPDQPTEREIWIDERARTNAIGQQQRANAMIAEFRQMSQVFNVWQEVRPEASEPTPVLAPRRRTKSGIRQWLIRGLKKVIQIVRERGRS